MELVIVADVVAGTARAMLVVVVVLLVVVVLVVVSVLALDRVLRFACKLPVCRCRLRFLFGRTFIVSCHLLLDHFFLSASLDTLNF